MLDVFMKQLSKELEADPAMEPTSPGVYEYYLTEDLAVIIKALPQGFTLFSTLGAYPKEKEEELFTLMMTGNLFGKETFGAVIGLEGEGRDVVLSRVVDYRIDFHEFKEILEDFVHIVNFWRTEAKIVTV